MRPKRYCLMLDSDLEQLQCCGKKGKCPNKVVAGIWFDWCSAPRNYCEGHCGSWASCDILREFKKRLRKIEPVVNSFTNSVSCCCLKVDCRNLRADEATLIRLCDNYGMKLIDFGYCAQHMIEMLEAMNSWLKDGYKSRDTDQIK